MSLRTPLLPHQEQAVEWMQQRERASRPGGGLLADDPGCGKTLDCIALMALDAEPGCNLVVAPTSLVLQWRDEILARTTLPADRVLVYHGADRQDRWRAWHGTTTASGAALRVVLTTYDVVRLEYQAHAQSHAQRGRTGSPPRDESAWWLSTRWHRVILDEAHRVRNAGSGTTQAVRALLSLRRWAVTGTPYNNGLQDLASIATFLGVPPYHHGWWWQLRAARHPTDLLAWRDACVLRRMKEDVLGDRLPALHERVVDVRLDEHEHGLYREVVDDLVALYDRSTRADRDGLGVSPNVGLLLASLTRLRQLVDHPLLLLGRAWLGVRAPTTTTTTITPSTSASGSGHADALLLSRCFVCRGACHPHAATAAGRSDARRAGVSTSWTTLRPLACGHAVCVTCDVPGERACRWCVRTRHWYGGGGGGDGDHGPWRASSKVRALLDHCRQVHAAEPGARVVLFSQWTGCLDVLEYFLARDLGARTYRYDGDLTDLHARNQVLVRFRAEHAPGTDDARRLHVLLTSLQCGGVGLNLTAAHHLCLFDAWYNPALESQAVDRVHRLGQTRPVQVVRFCVRGTIEEQVMAVQARKRGQAARVFPEPGPGPGSGTGAAADGGGEVWSADELRQLLASLGRSKRKYERTEHDDDPTVVRAFRFVRGRVALQHEPTSESESVSSARVANVTRDDRVCTR